MENNSEKLILVTNDDGYYARGIKCLSQIAGKFGKVVVVAPERSQSGMSHSVSLNTPLYLTKYEEKNGHPGYICSGTPADCVKIALHEVLERKPDLILSGINHGSNASVSSIYSGTVAAAREGSLNGVPSIGFSLLDHSPHANFDVAAHFAEVIIRKILESEISTQSCLNVNIPNMSLEQIKGIKMCRQTMGKWIEEFDHRTNPSNKDYYWLTGRFSNFEPFADDTDEWALENNYVAIVPIEVDSTSYQLLETMKKWEF